jgi:4-alpha-glucanotransferase
MVYLNNEQLFKLKAGGQRLIENLETDKEYTLRVENLSRRGEEIVKTFIPGDQSILALSYAAEREERKRLAQEEKAREQAEREQRAREWSMRSLILDGFDWWYKRMESSAKLYDVTRIDHFIGIVRYFSIPVECETAENGVYKKGPGKKLTDVIDKAMGDKQIIAEDLGIVVPAVEKLMEKTGYPGMKILEFAFDVGCNSEYLPHQYKNSNQVVYGGTHDNETLIGYFGAKSYEELKYAYEYLNVSNIWELVDGIIRVAYGCNLNAAIFQMQDILMLDNGARMNTPSELGDNWKWRICMDSFREEHIKKLESYACIYGRCEIEDNKLEEIEQ